VSGGASRAIESQLFGVRHHSPRACVVLRALLDRVRPDAVLIEGPADATPLIPLLAAADTVPPVALLAYRTDGQPGSSAWPFVAYSPELVALRWAVEHDKSVRFIDITSGQSLASAKPEETEEEDEEEEGADTGAAREEPDGYDLIARRSGFRSFEEFWEARFEAPAHAERGFRDAMGAFAEVVRHAGPRVAYHRARDAVMRAAIDAEIDAGVDPRRLVAVLGAAHATAILAGDVDPAGASQFTEAVPTQLTLIPYSFPRLAEQLGYGAGNRAPLFHQRAHDAGCDYRRATLESLVDFTDHLRLRGFGVSLADTLEAYRLACTLADMRKKSGPGIDEVRDATIATLCRGEAAHVDGFLWPTLVGKGIGKVAKGVAKNSLQEEFWRSVAAFKLPRTDEPEAVSLRLSDPVHVDISVFLHRLRVLGVPYAVTAGTTTKKGRAAPPDTGYKALSRVREAWECQWTPATELGLIESIVHGESLLAGAERRLDARLAEARSAGAASDVLVDAVMTSAMGTVARALMRCESLAAHDDDLRSLAAACRALAGVVAYGSSREALGLDETVLSPLLARTFARATLRLASACDASAEEAPTITEAMRVLQEIALTHRTVDAAAWIDAVRAVAESYTVHPRCAGAGVGLLLLASKWDDEELGRVVRLRVGAAGEPDKAADFLAGFLEVNALAVVKSAVVVEILDGYIRSLDDEAFRQAAPMLRRAFADLGKTERRYLVETLLAAGGYAKRSAAGAAARVVVEKDDAALRAAGDEIAKAMDDLEDLL
jgi:hypothetical protein